MQDIILKEQNETIVILKINRPDALNSLNTDVIEALTQIFTDEKHNPECAGIILTGAGDRSFVAGADIAEMKEMGPREARIFAHKGQALTNIIENFPKPVIAAVNGFALGGGNELAMSAHIRIASDNAKFGQPETGLGLIPGFGGTQRLTRLVGSGMAFQLNLSGQIIKADKALSIGLVNEVVSRDELMATCIELMQNILSKGPLATTYTIEAMMRGRDLAMNEALDLEADLFALTFSSTDKNEGISAFLDKRKADFKGN
ncbi:MAG: enoyl-CoA hydratase/isomerase family protein [Candidatus Marinimicrobia bacterium]|nr:enoyl-CoA hydratase/isomerase family protein [Candidatus Neomarinimicrobiota bacterium]